MTVRLEQQFAKAAEAWPDRLAVLDPAQGQSVTYGDLLRLVERLTVELRRFGVGAGDRVGLLANKSVACVVGILATLRAGAAYVPVDPHGPPSRAVEIFSDCGVKGVIGDGALADRLLAAWDPDLVRSRIGVSNLLSGVVGDLIWLRRGEGPPSPVHDLAYILYTSGSTGKPKGVMHSHSSAAAFVEWCSETFRPTPEDRFSSHAPFHFDLSILDLFVPLSHGAAVVLIGEEEGKNPRALASLIAVSRVSVWYSTPSVLRLLVEYGGLDQYPASDLRLVLFAGEVFAPRQLRELQRSWSGPRYFNLYGPTETNVCTFYEVPSAVPPDRDMPYPIGKPISKDRAFVLDSAGGVAEHGTEGELLVSGGTVMAGYWNRPDLNERAFLWDDRGDRWYRTGDIVKEDEPGEYVFLGGRDRMIKRSGYRIELGEIEAALYRHPDIREAAVVAGSGSDHETRVHAYVCWNGAGSASVIALKSFCAQNLPLYMVPDSFAFLDEIPKTSTDKVDYMQLSAPGGP